jgi:hypothetical protein
MIKALEREMGRQTLGYKFRKMMEQVGFGKGGAEKWVRLNPPKFFETHPLLSLSKGYRGIGIPTSKAQAIQHMVRDFGVLTLDSDQARQFKAKTLKLPGYQLVHGMPGRPPLAVPTELSHDFRRLMRHYESDESIKVLAGLYDSVQSWFKGQLLISPWFHTRNWISGIWQGAVLGNVRGPMPYIHATRMQAMLGRFGHMPKMLAGGAAFGGVAGAAMAEEGETLEGILKGAAAGAATGGAAGLLNRVYRARAVGKNLLENTHVTTRMGEKISYAEIVERFKRGGGYGPAFFEYQTVRPGKAGAEAAERTLRPDKWMFRLNAEAMQGVEENLRLAQFTDGLQRGLSDVQAMQEVAHTHFLYETLEPVFRRGVGRAVPFVAWLRFNVPRQLYAMIQRPVAHRSFQKVVDLASLPEASESEAMNPDWARRHLSVPIERTKSGKVTHLFLGSYLPIADVFQLAEGPVEFIVDQIGVFPLKTLAEAKWNIRLSDIPRGDAGRKIEYFPDQRTQFMGMNVTKKWQHRLKLFRVLSDADRLVGPIFNTKHRQRERMEDKRLRLVAALLGVRSTVIDPEQQAARLTMAAKREEGAIRTAYMRALVEGDWANVEQARGQLIEMGLRIPTGTEVLRFKRRSRKSRASLRKEARRRYPVTTAPDYAGVGIREG